MRFSWLPDNENKKELDIFWGAGSGNKSDYFTNHFPPTYHHSVRRSLLVSYRTVKIPTRPLMRKKSFLPRNFFLRTRSLLQFTYLGTKPLINTLSRTTLRGFVDTCIRQYKIHSRNFDYLGIPPNVSTLKLQISYSFSVPVNKLIITLINYSNYH